MVGSYSHLYTTASSSVTGQSRSGPIRFSLPMPSFWPEKLPLSTPSLPSLSFTLFSFFSFLFFCVCVFLGRRKFCYAEMAVDLMGYRSENFSAKLEENAVQEAASGLESVDKLIRLLSQAQQHNMNHHQQQQDSSKYPLMEIDLDCKAVADAAVSKFKKVISLLGRTRTGHARFRRAPLPSSSSPLIQSYEKPVPETKVYYATPIQQIPPLHHGHDPALIIPKNGVIERKDSSTTINFSYSSPATSFISSLTGDTDSKPPCSSSAFQITNLSQVSSAGKPPLSTSSLKRKCSSENLGSGKCGAGSSGRCHCSKKRWVSLSISLST